MIIVDSSESLWLFQDEPPSQFTSKLLKTGFSIVIGRQMSHPPALFSLPMILDRSPRATLTSQKPTG